MRDNLSRPSRRRSLTFAATALPVTFALGASLLAPATATAQSSGSSLPGGISDGAVAEGPVRSDPIRTDHPDSSGLPDGVEIDRVDWIDNRELAIYLRSAAMPEQTMKVQMLLARDWFSQPDRSFPSVWALDGLRARDDGNGWLLETDIKSYFADKNVNVILPVGGQSSFYSDWQQPDNGRNYQWETFFIDELMPVLQQKFRTTTDNAVTGISMGGTAAMNLAERRPDRFRFVASFSGYLDTTSPGMPEAITAAMMDAGRFNSRAMWGEFGSQDWIDHDPKLGIDALKDMTVYVSSGSGRDDFGNPNSVARGPANLAGIGLEAISRMTSETFVNRAKRDNVNVISRFRPSGVHSWEYWQFEITQAWPDIADALNLDEADRGRDCAPVGAIAAATEDGHVGTCLNNEYPVNGGQAQDFTGGQVFWSPSTGAHALYGRIGARYAEMGGAESWLGFPLTSEQVTPDGVGRYVHFQNGSIYWTPQLGATPVPKDIMAHWGTTNYERGDLGYPVKAPESAGNGLWQQFQHGYIVRDNKGDNYWLRGLIGERYGQMGGPNSPLGFPTSDEKLIPGGAFQEFEHGNLYWSPSTGAHFILKGAIFNAWGEQRWERGEFGYPTTDQEAIPSGGQTIDFQHGTIREVNGRIEKEQR